MIKNICFVVTAVSVIFSAGISSAQSRYYDSEPRRYEDSYSSRASSSAQDLKEELARERYLTEIAIERHKREKLERESEIRSYDSRMKEAQYRRVEQERQISERNSGINSINQGVNVLGNIARVAGIVAGR